MKVQTRRERERAERREAILSAAQAVFADKGFAAATMEDVAAAAELSKGTLYLYFKNKDDLFIAMSSCVLDSIHTLIRKALDTEATGRAALAAALTRYAAFAIENHDNFRTAIIWIASGTPVDTTTQSFHDHRACVRAVHGCLAEAIARGSADGTFRADLDPVASAARVWAAMIGALLLRINAEEVTRRFETSVDVDSFISGFVEMLCDGLAPRAGEASR